MSDLNTTNDVETVDVSVAGDGTIARTDAANARETIRTTDFKSVKLDRTRNPRRAERYDPKHNGKLARNIFQYGLLDAPVVSERENGELWLLKGHLRHAAIELLRTNGLEAEGSGTNKLPAINADPHFMDKIKVRVIKGLSLSEEIDMLMDHGTTTPLDKKEKFVAAQQMRRMGFTQAMIADKLGMSRAAFSKLDWVLSMPQCVADAYLSDDDNTPNLNEPTIGKLYTAYRDDQKNGARIKQGGPKFNAAWEDFLKSGSNKREKAMSATDIIKLAEVESDSDLQDLLDAISKNNAQGVGQALERIRIRLNESAFPFQTEVTEEGITHTVGE